MSIYQVKWSLIIIKDKYAVRVEKNNVVIGHLSLGKSGKLAKMIFYFLRADPLSVLLLSLERQ